MTTTLPRAYSGPTVSRSEALQTGLKRFFDGRPCPHGHVAERLVSNYTCMECTRLRKFSLPEDQIEKKRQYMRDWRRKNPEVARVRRREYILNNREKHYAAIIAWHKANPDRLREIKLSAKHRRRARIAQWDGCHYTTEELVALWESVPHRCAACSCDITVETRHIDHIVPLARGGSNSIRNIQFLCAHCNRVKNARDPAVFMRELGFLI